MTDRQFFDNEKTLVTPVSLAERDAALVIIDMQYMDASATEGFALANERLAPGSMAYYCERIDTVVIPTIQKLAASFRAHGMPVIYLAMGSRYRDLRDMPQRVRDGIQALERESGVEDIFWTEGPGFAIREEIAPEPDDVVLGKVTYGAFGSSNLDLLLHQLGCRSVVVCGVSTNCCVESTARDAVDRGFGCVVVDEGTADCDQEAHDASLRALFYSFARIARSADEVIAALELRVPV
jgi:biuret amidohydrolase